MSEINLGYGSESINLSIDDSRFRVLSRTASPEIPLTDLQIGEALTAAIGSPPIDDLFGPGESVLLVVSDATRATASAQVVNLVVRRLIQNGVSPSDIAIIFATGIHRAVTQQEKNELLTPFITQRVRTIDHDAYNPAFLTDFGKTTRGTKVELNKALRDFSRVLVIGGVAFHYFAGFTGGRKSICPGLASAKTIEATHMLALDFETGGRRTGVHTGALAGNAVHEECDEIASMVAPSFVVNTVVDDVGRAVKTYAGDWRQSHQAACDEYLENHSVAIDGPRELVIVSCGGSPWDINLIQAHKALDMAAQACTAGGTIVLLAECPDGLGRKDFLKWFDEPDSRRLEQRLRGAYEVNGQTAWALLMKAERFRVHLISELPDDEVKRMRMQPTSLKELQQIVSRAPSGYVMPRGAALMPRLID